MPKFTITYSILFKMLRQLNRACADGKHYTIVLDMNSFHLCLNGEIIYCSSDVQDFFGRLLLEFRCVSYPRELELAELL